MVSLTFIRKQTPLPALLAGLGLALFPAVSRADDLSNRAFQITYDASGITSLKRTADVADTDYIAANGALGRLIVRYRTSAHGDWRELRDLLLRSRAAGNPEIRYTLGSLLPTIASRASGSAVQGVAGIRGLNDGIVPIIAGAGGGGRGGGRGVGPGPGAAGPPLDVPTFTWAGSRGTTQWVQYTFPAEEEIAKTEVFWTVAPQSWRVLYQDGGQWKEVAPSTALPSTELPSTQLRAGRAGGADRPSYGREINTFSSPGSDPGRRATRRARPKRPPPS